MVFFPPASPVHPFHFLPYFRAGMPLRQIGPCEGEVTNPNASLAMLRTVAAAAANSERLLLAGGVNGIVFASKHHTAEGSGYWCGARKGLWNQGQSISVETDTRDQLAATWKQKDHYKKPISQKALFLM